METALSLFLVLLFLLPLTIQGLGPAPAPESGDGVGVGSVSVNSPPKSPTVSNPPSLPPPAVELDTDGELNRAPPPVAMEEAEEENEKNGSEDKKFSGSPAIAPPVAETGSATVRWCTVRDEFFDCQYYLGLLRQTEGYDWKCVRKETIQECLHSIKKGEADLINLDPGLAYVAFLDYSMKVIANEVYCNHAESYDVVAVVNKKSCKEKEDISLIDFKGKRSCHGGYRTATGWNYPINHLKTMVPSKKLNDREILKEFFSDVCAPSEFEGMGLCSGCGHENGTCHSSSLYSGPSGAFRCLVEELGDIAFVKADTALLYSLEGPYNQTWSKRSISDFMYLCPQGGCREINGYPGDCSFGSVPANVIMVANSISSKKRSAVLQTMLNATWTSALYAGKNGASHLLSSSTQGLNVVKKLTRSYLGISASISQIIQELDIQKVQAVPSTVNSVSDVPTSSSSCAKHPWILASVFTLLAIMSSPLSI